MTLWRQNCAGLSWGPNMYFKNIWKIHMKLEILLSCEFSKWLECQVNSADPGWEPFLPFFSAEHLQVILSEIDRVKVKPQLKMAKNVSLLLWSFLSWESRLKASFSTFILLFHELFWPQCSEITWKNVSISSFQEHYDVVFNYKC